MKKMILGVSLVAVLALMSGCGDSDDDNKVDIDAVVVEYKNSATYDLSEYLFSAQSQTNSYVNKAFSNNQGKKSYSTTPDATTYPIIKFDVNGSTIKEFDADGDLDTTSVIVSDRINSVEDDAFTVARFADKGDYVFKRISNEQDGSVKKLACKVSNQLATKKVGEKTYDDVIEMICNLSSSQTTTIGGKDASAVSEGIMIDYFAKDNGNILSTIESCSQTKIGDSVVSQLCEKEIKEITNIIK